MFFLRPCLWNCPLSGPISRPFSARGSKCLGECGWQLEEAKVEPSGKVVLIVDDDSSIRNLLSLYIQERGHSFLLAANGQQALSLSRTYPRNIDLLLSDVDMPGMNGLRSEERRVGKEWRSRWSQYP